MGTEQCVWVGWDWRVYRRVGGIQELEVDMSVEWGQHLKGTEQWGQVFKNVKQKGGTPLYTLG